MTARSLYMSGAAEAVNLTRSESGDQEQSRNFTGSAKG
jgi:hypothetical protein